MTNPVIKAEFTFCRDGAKKPSRKRPSDAGYDVTTVTGGIIEPKSSKVFYTGLQLALPPYAFYRIGGRSGMGMANIVPFPGTVDGCYTGEVVIKLFNFSDEPYEIHPGDRIAQLIPAYIINLDMHQVNEFSSEYSVRGDAGFGSSGR